MKKVIQVAVKEPQYVVSTDVAFAQVDAWFGHTVRDLKLDVIYPEHHWMFIRSATAVHRLRRSQPDMQRTMHRP